MSVEPIPPRALLPSPLKVLSPDGHLDAIRLAEPAASFFDYLPERDLTVVGFVFTEADLGPRPDGYAGCGRCARCVAAPAARLAGFATCVVPVPGDLGSGAAAMRFTP
jgi:hypothetical protein